MQYTAQDNGIFCMGFQGLTQFGFRIYFQLSYEKKILTVKLRIASSTDLILLNLIKSVVNDRSWYTTSGI